MKPNIHFDEVDKSFLALSRTWLDDEKFRNLIMANPIDEFGQSLWYDELPSRSNYRIWGVKVKNKWIGACGLKNIDLQKQTAEYWGYIYPKNFRGIGLGWEMFNMCRVHGEKNGLSTLYLNVTPENLSACDAYQRWGFSVTDRGSPNIINMELEI